MNSVHQSARAGEECNLPSTYQEKKQDVGGGQEESGLWKDKLGGDANPAKIC